MPDGLATLGTVDAPTAPRLDCPSAIAIDDRGVVVDLPRARRPRASASPTRSAPTATRSATASRRSPATAPTRSCCSSRARRPGSCSCRSRGGCRRASSPSSSRSRSPRCCSSRTSSPRSPGPRSSAWRRCGCPSPRSARTASSSGCRIRPSRPASPRAARRRRRRPLLIVFTSGTTSRAEGRRAHARELLLDEPLAVEDVGVTHRRRRAGGPAAVPRRRLEHPAAAGLVDGRDRRARAHVRPRAACSHLIAGAPHHDDDGRAGELPVPRAAPRLPGTDLSSLGHAVVGGAPMPPALLRTWHARGVSLTQGYGLTEASPNVLCLPDDEAASPRRLGRRAVRARRRRGRRRGDRGTARRRGRGRAARARTGGLRRLLPRPRATAEAIRGGWLHTGDLVRRDADGYFTIVDRLRTSTSRAARASPRRGRGRAHGPPGGRRRRRRGRARRPRGARPASRGSCCRPGRDHGRRGARGVRRVARSRRYKVPRDVHFIDEMPRSTAAKALRRVARGARRAARGGGAGRSRGDRRRRLAEGASR